MQSTRTRYLLLVSFLIFWGIPTGGKAQDSKKSDYSSEAYVIEQVIDRWTFENDGTGTREQKLRVHIQSDAGLERFGVLTIPYQKAVETAEIDYVRVRKPDGSVIPTGLDDLQDMPAEVTREAPFYSDLREKHLAVKGLNSGDILEVQCHWNLTKPLIPGQFWMSLALPRDQVILEQKVQVSVPRERAVKFKSANVAPVITEEGQRRVYTWTRSNLESERRPKAESADMAIHGQLPAPDIQLSSFQSWEEIGRWYGGLQQDRVVPTPEIKAKAAELTRNATDDLSKIQAIYKYVSTEYRYIGVAFGIGRYQPHSAAEVLSNQYGDCKDKHTLLAALLGAAGIPAYPALINSSRVLDPDVPSPAQFDHVITAVSRGKEFLWLDTTTEVGPFGYLVLPLRGKQSLVVLADKPAAFQATPENSLFPDSWTFKINAKIDESGTLEGKVEQTLRGDLEVIWRSALRRLPRTQWKDAIQRLSYATGFAGDVSDVTASTPEAIETPLRFGYTYRRKQYPDWENHRISPPAPFSLSPPLEEDGKLPQHFWLGAPGKLEFESRVELPKGYAPDLPSNKDIEKDFAEYHSHYAFENNALIVRFTVVVKTGELSGNAVTAYKEMAESVIKERTQFIMFSALGQSSESISSVLQQAWQLPDSTDAKALHEEQEAKSAIQAGLVHSSLEALQRAVDQDPKFTRAWIRLGQLYLFSFQPDAGIRALRRAANVDSQQTLPWKVLAFGLAFAGRRGEAIEAWQNLARLAPDDRDISVNVGNLLLAEKRFAEAVPYLEAIVKLYPENSAEHMSLATAYLNSGQEDKAAGEFEIILKNQPTAETRNDIAYVLANANRRLDDALRYAQEAVKADEEASRQVQLSNLVVTDLRPTVSLGAYWDTLGWVYYKQGNLKQAEGYLYAAWTLSQDPVIGYHLAQVYEKQQRKQDATHMYRFVASVSQYGRGAEALDAIAEAKKQLGSRPGETPRKVGHVIIPDNPGGELSQERTVTLPKLVSKQASADFFLAFAPESKAGNTSTTHGSVVEDTKFVSGSDLLRSAGQALRQARFKVAFPEGSSGRLVRRGILACYPLTGCTFVLIPVESVRRVD